MEFPLMNGKVEDNRELNDQEKRHLAEDLCSLRKMLGELAGRVSYLEEVMLPDYQRVPNGNLLSGMMDNGFSAADVPTTYSSSAIYSPSSLALLPTTPARSDMYSMDGRSSGVSSLEGSPPLAPLQPISGDFFLNSSMGNGGAYSNGIDYTSGGDRGPDFLRDPMLFANLVQQMNRGGMVPEMSPPRGSSAQSMYYSPSMSNAPLRRNNSNRTRRSRRYSLPNENRSNQWPVQSRHGSFIGLSPEMSEELGADDPFGDVTVSRSASSKELEILCRFGEIGVGKGQMNSPHGFCLGFEEQIIVADTNNHRIQIFDKCGNALRFWGKAGKRDGHLWHPRKVAYMPENSRIVVCDRGQDRSRIQIFSYIGDYQQNIRLDYVAIVAGMTVYQNQIIIVDSVNPTCLVMDPDQDGRITFWFDCRAHMKEPSDVVVDRQRQLFLICDFKDHCIAVFNGRGQFVKRIGDRENINYPNGIDITQQGQIMVGDSHGNRFHVAAYSPEGQLLAEYECPHMKVSRCCGLALTSENHIVTIAKNNNFILILDRVDGSGGHHGRALLEAEVEQQETVF